MKTAVAAAEGAPVLPWSGVRWGPPHRPEDGHSKNNTKEEPKATDPAELFMGNASGVKATGAVAPRAETPDTDPTYCSQAFFASGAPAPPLGVPTPQLLVCAGQVVSVAMSTRGSVSKCPKNKGQRSQFFSETVPRMQVDCEQKGPRTEDVGYL